MTTTRLSRFVVVGALGFVVQMVAAMALLASGAAPLLATAVAIEAAIVHNHAWHRRWAWRDRTPAHSWPATLWRAHLGAGATSLVVGVGTVALLHRHVGAIAAQVVAVVLCAALNYLIADRWVFARRTRGAVAVRSPLVPPASIALLVLVGSGAPASAGGPSAAAIQSWERYAAALDRARAADLAANRASWATDDSAAGAEVLAALRRGAVVVGRRRLAGVDVQDATLEHWQGSVLLRGVTLAQVTERVRHPDRHRQPPDVLALRVQGRTADGHEVYLRLTRSLLVTATYDTWHRVRHVLVGPTRLHSTSESTRIDEIHDPGTSAERRVALAESRGFLWRMRSAWRFATVAEGVVVTCESITLSRPVPIGLGLVSRPIITRVARESMSTAVGAWR